MRAYALATLLLVGCPRPGEAPSTPSQPAIPPTPVAPALVERAPIEPVAPTLDALPIEGVRWQVSELDGAAFTADAWLQIDQRVLTGRGGCNRLTSPPLSIDGDQIAFGHLTATRMACPELAQEQALITALSEVDRFAIEGDTLLLFTEQTQRAQLVRSAE